MTGSNMTSMTLEEMREACACGEDRSDWEQVRRDADAGVEPAPDAESPDASALLRAEIEKRRRGRPRGTTKVSTTVRFDREVLDAFRAAGPGWQSRMNDALKDWLKIHEQHVGPAGLEREGVSRQGAKEHRTT